MIQNKNTRDNFLEEVIIGYRNIVSQRYQYENLEKKYIIQEVIYDKIVSKRGNFLGLSLKSKAEDNYQR